MLFAMKTSEENISQAELKMFDELADEWWNPSGKLKTLHVINPLRIQYINNAVCLKNSRVLDIGCGGGILCEAMARESARVTGIDISVSAIEAARKHQQAGGLSINYLSTTVEDMVPGHEHYFDLITCMEMLEHVPDPVSIIESAAQLLAPGGHFFLATINRSLKSFLGPIIAAEYLLKLIPRGTHHYSQFIRPSELAGWLRASGFDIEDVSGVKYVPFIDHASLSDDTSVNYMIHARLRG